MSYNHQQNKGLTKVLKVYLSLLQVPFTAKSLEQTLYSHAEYPNLLAISEALHEWKIENVALQLHPHQLQEIDSPFLAYLPIEEGIFVAVKHIQENLIEWYHPQKAWQKSSLQEFISKWNGTVLLAEATKQSGEPDYQKNKRKEQLQRLEQGLSLSLLLVACFIGLCFIKSITVFGLLLGNGLGLLASIFLLMQEIGFKNTFVQQVCNLNKHTNCEAILASKASKLLGWLSWAEVGLVYFTAFLWLSYASVFSTQSDSVLAVLSILSMTALPYTLFSVYYQAFVLKHWCPLCLVVQGVLWFNALLFLPYINLSVIQTIHFQTIAMICAVWMLVLALWFAIKSWLFKIPAYKSAEMTVLRFQRNSDLLGAYLDAQTPTTTYLLPNEIVLGNPEASTEVMIVSNPFCSPCGIAHQIVASLLEHYSESIKFIIRFIPDKPETDSERNQVILHLLSLSSNTHQINEAMSEWYEIRKYAEWSLKYPIEKQLAKEMLQPYVEWTASAKIESTPAVFINGRLIKDPYSYNDLKYHLRHFIENTLYSNQ